MGLNSNRRIERKRIEIGGPLHTAIHFSDQIAAFIDDAPTAFNRENLLIKKSFVCVSHRSHTAQILLIFGQAMALLIHRKLVDRQASLAEQRGEPVNRIEFFLSQSAIRWKHASPHAASWTYPKQDLPTAFSPLPRSDKSECMQSERIRRAAQNDSAAIAQIRGEDVSVGQIVVGYRPKAIV